MVSRKREAFGVSLLDVLSNALVGAIVLMLIASVFTKVLNDVQEEDPAQGEATVPTSPLFPPRDPVKSDDLLIVALHFGSWAAAPEDIQLSFEGISGSTEAWADSCISIMRGSYDPTYWLVIRTCPCDDGRVWGVRLRSGANDGSQLPRYVDVHANSGVSPLKGERRYEISWNGRSAPLLQVEEGNVIPQVSRW
jgi:hypothetical protein